MVAVSSPGGEDRVGGGSAVAVADEASPSAPSSLAGAAPAARTTAAAAVAVTATTNAAFAGGSEGEHQQHQQNQRQQHQQPAPSSPVALRLSPVHERLPHARRIVSQQAGGAEVSGGTGTARTAFFGPGERRGARESGDVMAGEGAAAGGGERASRGQVHA